MPLPFAAVSRDERTRGTSTGPADQEGGNAGSLSSGRLRENCTAAQYVLTCEDKGALAAGAAGERSRRPACARPAWCVKPPHCSTQPCCRQGGVRPAARTATKRTELSAQPGHATGQSEGLPARATH